MRQPLTDLLRGAKRKFEFPESARNAFAALKKAIADVSQLGHPDPNVPLTLHTDASNTAIGAVLQQIRTDRQPRPLAFFSKRLQPAEARYSTFGRELLAIYAAIRHLRHVLEGRQFTVFTDHKPLVYALRASADRYSPREIRHLDYISQFTTDIRHVPGEANTVADVLSRIHAISDAVNTPIDLAAMANAPSTDSSAQRCRSSSLVVRTMPLFNANGTILCETSLDNPRLIGFSPNRFRRTS